MSRPLTKRYYAVMVVYDTDAEKAVDPFIHDAINKIEAMLDKTLSTSPCTAHIHDSRIDFDFQDDATDEYEDIIE